MMMAQDEVQPATPTSRNSAETATCPVQFKNENATWGQGAPTFYELTVDDSFATAELGIETTGYTDSNKQY